ncbi:phytoalexin-deficient 4-2 protein [Trifolium pratense]|uniref:Phytoalexin-deficient 4-2 protein n=1 Tax=Trifolium pratense TaxID=57577 RepID=A0A2K3N5Y9_TRIPR|nr:phytoalexin-deficient 4-2 protein [Trifolium pratense]PNX98436.1 phytoalexin-deficient 4-2 protein [Trifolium pratense]PNY00574.1 phytoalexin-deficient 4-2 protein [Trifolium pratense]
MVQPNCRTIGTKPTEKLADSRFSSGIELAPFVTSSSLLRKSWNVITSRDVDIVSNDGVGLSWKVYKEPNTDVTFVAFEAIPSDSSNLQSELVSSIQLKEKNFLHFEFLCTKANPCVSLNNTAVSLKEKNFLHFEFLCTKANPCVSLNNTAVSLFCKNYQKLDLLKSEISSSSKLIITGLALGGSIASLFTLSLLNSLDSKKKKPLCITFGSPLIGDKSLQKSISQVTSWNSCFIHVVSCNDPLPRKFFTNHTSSYVPFGTFLMSYDAYSTCFENPDSVLAILESSIHDQNQVFHSLEYGKIVERLYHEAICKDNTNQTQGMNYSNSLHACISLQMLALGLAPHMQVGPNSFNVRLHSHVEVIETSKTMTSRSKSWWLAFSSVALQS